MNRNDQNFIAQKIRAQYMEKDSAQKDLDLLRELDAEVKRPANMFGYVFGASGAIVMGAGMSLVMTDIGAQLEIAVLFCVTPLSSFLSRSILSASSGTYFSRIFLISSCCFAE